MNQRIHPQTIAAGWRIARNLAREALEKLAFDHSAAGLGELFKRDLLRIATTMLSFKLLTHKKEYFANLESSRNPENK